MDIPFNIENVVSRISYSTKLENITQRFLKIILDEKQFSVQLEIDSTRHTNQYTKKLSWFLVNEEQLYVKVYYETNISDFDSSTVLLAKVFSEIPEYTSVYTNECSCRLFHHELKMQQNVLPTIETLLGSKISLEMYHHSNKFKVIFMKDLLKQGYQMISVYKGMTADNCIEAIQLMARLHAASVALYEKDPELVEALTMKNMATTGQCEHLMQIFHYNMKRAIALMEKTPPHELIAEQMRTVNYYIETAEQILDMFNCEPEEFRVLNNGDFSITNVLFSTQGLPPVMQHYQMANYSSPAIDLHHFLNTSPEIKVIYNDESQMLNIYLKTLTNAMEALNCTTKPPTMEQLKASMQKRELYAVFAAMTFRLSIMDTEERKQEMDCDPSPFEQLAIKMSIAMNYRKYFENIINRYNDSQSASPVSSNGEQ